MNEPKWKVAIVSMVAQRGLRETAKSLSIPQSRVAKMVAGVETAGRRVQDRIRRLAAKGESVVLRIG